MKVEIKTERDNKRIGRKKLLVSAVAVVAVCAGLIAAAVAAKYVKEKDSAAYIGAIGQAMSYTLKGAAEESFAPFASAELRDAYFRNPEVVGWLRVDGCEIDDPVVQAQDNEKYLRRTAFSEEYDAWGCYFLDYINSSDGYVLKDRVSVIYGHSLGDDPDADRFSKLKRYQSPRFCAEHAEIVLSLLFNETAYSVFSACEIPVAIDYIDPEPDDEKYENLLDYLVSNSSFDFGVEVGTDDNILILSTCTSDENVRFVVAAVSR